MFRNRFRRQFHTATAACLADTSSTLYFGTGAISLGALLYSIWPRQMSKEAKQMPAWQRAGLGVKPYSYHGALPDGRVVDATSWPGGSEIPNRMPFFGVNPCIAAEVFRYAPQIWGVLRSKTTSSGVTIADVLKPGVDGKVEGGEIAGREWCLGRGEYLISGAVACDEESYFVFKEIFDGVIAHLFSLAPNSRVFFDSDASKIEDTGEHRMDPWGSYVISSRIEIARSIRGYRLLPACSYEERRLVEAEVVNALLDWESEFQGQYVPTKGSKSWRESCRRSTTPPIKKEMTTRPGGVVQPPISYERLCAGEGRHWPDARGVFHSSDGKVAVRINHQDHIRIASFSDTPDGLKECFKRAQQVEEDLQHALGVKNIEFMHNSHLGYISAWPERLGSGLSPVVVVRLPLLSQRKYFYQLASVLRLNANPVEGAEEGVFELSSPEALGHTEVELTNNVIAGVKQMVRYEFMLSKGLPVEHVLPPKRKVDLRPDLD